MRLSIGKDIEEAADTPLQRKLLYTYNGQIKNLRQWSFEIGIPYRVLYDRMIRRNWTIDRAFTTKVINE